MSLRTRLVSTVVSLTLAAGALAGTAQPSAAGKLSKEELAALVGIGGFVVGAAVANASRGPDYYGDHRSSWDRHVDRCYDRYRSYDASTDTYVGYDGRLHYCQL